MTTVSVKIKDSDHDRIKSIADSRRRTPHWIMRDAIEQYLEREEKREALKNDAMRAFENYQRTGLHANEQEVDAWLKELEKGKKPSTPKCHV